MISKEIEWLIIVQAALFVAIGIGFAIVENRKWKKEREEDQ